MNKQTDKLDEILAQAMFGDRFTLAQAQNIAEFKQARTEILKHYISRDEVMEIIGEDEEVPINDVGGRVPARVLRNDLRETQRQAINKIKGELQ